MASEVTGSSGETAEKKPSATISVPVLGFPGERYSMILKNAFKEPDGHLNQVPLSGLPGEYRVTFVMGKPGMSTIPEREITFAEFTRGDSHLAILAPAFPAPADAMEIRLAVKVESESFGIRGFANETGYLAKLETDAFHAQNRNDAELRATRVVQGLLSEYSAGLDIPLQIQLIEVTELSTSNKSLTLAAPFLGGGSSAPIETHDREFGNLAALYREGLLSNSSVYRYLCFYKILEVSRKRRERLGRKLKTAYKPLWHGERIPVSQPEQISWLAAIFLPRQWPELMLNQIFPLEARGKKLTALFDGELRRLRDRTLVTASSLCRSTDAKE